MYKDMNKFEPYFYYIFAFFGLVVIVGVLIFIAYHATKE